MQHKLLMVGLLASAILPGVASAQPYYDPGCVRANQDNHAAGTVLGAIGGALLGSAVAGRHDRGAGAVIGGVGGAVAGNAIAGSNDHPCPEGYYYRGSPPPPPPPQAGFWYGAPEGIHERIDFLQNRINRTADGGWLAPRQIERLNADLNDVRHEDRRLRYQDGGDLRPVDRDYLLHRLDNISEQLHWAEHNR